MIDKGRYFTIFAPRQSGKTTFFIIFAGLWKMIHCIFQFCSVFKPVLLFTLEKGGTKAILELIFLLLYGKFNQKDIA
jgi:hypothetical protein